MLFGALVWVATWQGSDRPVVHDLGVLVEAPDLLLTIYLFLAFPMGRIEPRAARRLMWRPGASRPARLPALGLLRAGDRRRRAAVAVRGGLPGERAPDRQRPEVAEVAGKAEIYSR